MGLGVHFPNSILGSCLVWTYTGPVHCHNLWFPMCISSLVFGSCCLLVVSPGLQSFCLTFYIDPEPWGEGFAKDAPTPLRAECSEVSQSLHNVWFWISLLIVMSFKWLLWRGLSNAVLSFMKIGFLSFLIVYVGQLSNRAPGYQTPSPSRWSPQFPVVIITVP